MSLLITRKKQLLLSFGTTTLFLILCVLFLPIQFETNDDSGILLHWAGYFTETPSAYEMNFSTISLGFIVSRLYMILPSLPWYTIVHLFILWLSSSLICFCIIGNGLKTKKAFAISVTAMLCLLFTVYVNATMMIQFTTTSALPAGAAIALLIHYKKRGRNNFIFTLFMVTLLMAFSFSMRPEPFYLGILLFICVAAVLLIKNRRWRSHTILFTALPLILVSALYVINTNAYNSNEYKPFSEYTAERVKFMDYLAPYSGEDPDIHIKSGLDEVEYKMLRNWYFLFDKVNTETFKRLNQNTTEYIEKNSVSTDERTFADIIAAYEAPVFESRYHTYCAFILFILSVIVIFMPTGGSRVNLRKTGFKKFGAFFITRYSNKIIALGIFAFVIVSGIYFVKIGRFPSRVYRSLILISLPALFMMASNVIQSNKLARAAGSVRIYFTGLTASALTIVILIGNSIIGVTHISELRELKKMKEYTYGVGVEYADNHPDDVYITDLYLITTLNPLATYHDKKTASLVLPIGCGILSPTFYEQLRVNGFDETVPLQELMLAENTYYMTLNKNSVFYEYHYHFISNMSDSIISYYQEHYPDYEFVKVDETPDSSIDIYKLQTIQ